MTAALSPALAACSASAHLSEAARVGNCTSGVLFLTPGQARAGSTVNAIAEVRCTPGSYRVVLTVVGMESDAWNLGSLTTTSSGTLAGTLHIPVRAPPGFARASVVANFACPAGQRSCSVGAAGGITVLPSS